MKTAAAVIVRKLGKGSSKTTVMSSKKMNQRSLGMERDEDTPDSQSSRIERLISDDAGGNPNSIYFKL